MGFRGPKPASVVDDTPGKMIKFWSVRSILLRVEKVVWHLAFGLLFKLILKDTLLVKPMVKRAEVFDFDALVAAVVGVNGLPVLYGKWTWVVAPDILAVSAKLFSLDQTITVGVMFCKFASLVFKTPVSVVLALTELGHVNLELFCSIDVSLVVLSHIIENVSRQLVPVSSPSPCLIREKVEWFDGTGLLVSHLFAF